MARKQLLGIIFSLMLIASSWFGVATLRTGLIVHSITQEGLPMIFIAPKGVTHRPGILIAHGFAGSKQLMYGYGYTLARNGYGVLLLDFDGHGANAAPFSKSKLQKNFDTALTVFRRQPEVAPDEIGVLGHSMGSRVVMVGGIEQSKTISAVVAISPTAASVTPSKPRNLQLQAGEWEHTFVQQSADLLKRAGGLNANLENGEGRSRVIVPQAEHILILFKDRSHQAALQWFNAVFHQTSEHPEYRDRRMAWYSLHLFGWLLLLWVISPLLNYAQVRSLVRARPLRSWIGLVVTLPMTAGIVYGISLRASLSSLGGMLVGGALGLWLFVAGLIWIGIISRFPRATVKSIGYGFLLFAVLWIGFGSMAQETWLQWWLNPERLKLWPLLSCACFPWFLAAGTVQSNSSIGKRIAWWFAQSMCLIIGLTLTLSLIPELSFLALIVPIIPLILAILSFTAAQTEDVWSSAMASALFFGWTIAAIFPLAQSNLN